MSEIIRVYITDDHHIVRRGIKQLLSTEPGIEVVGEATNGREAIADMDKLKPDIVLMDLVMPARAVTLFGRMLRSGGAALFFGIGGLREETGVCVLFLAMPPVSDFLAVGHDALFEEPA